MSTGAGESQNSQGGGFDFRTLLSLASLIAAAAAIYYAFSVDTSDRVGALEGSLKSLDAKVRDLPTEDGVKTIIDRSVTIPPAGPTRAEVQTMIAEGRLSEDQVQAQIDRSVPTADQIQALIDNSVPTTDQIQALIDQSKLTAQEVQALIDRSTLTERDVETVVARALEEVREEIGRLPDEDRVRAIAVETAGTADQRLVETEIPGLISSTAVPKGAVVAFANGCPTDAGWQEYAPAKGRFLVAVGTNVDANGTERAFSPGIGNDGEYEHTLTTDEMPAHRHGIDRQGPTRGIEGLPPIGTDGAIIDTIEQEMSQPAGKGQPHNNVPPYIALHFCEKT